MQVQIIISEAKCGNLKINRQKYHPPQMLHWSFFTIIHWCCYFFKKQVFSVTGDGSIELNIQELKTISHYQLNIKTFVINNGGYVSIQK